MFSPNLWSPSWQQVIQRIQVWKNLVSFKNKYFINFSNKINLIKVCDSSKTKFFIFSKIYFIYKYVNDSSMTYPISFFQRTRLQCPLQSVILNPGLQVKPRQDFRIQEGTHRFSTLQVIHSPEQDASSSSTLNGRR